MRPDYAHFNPVSLKTLSRGYLREGIAQEDLFDAAVARSIELVDTAEGILGFTLPTLRTGLKRGWVSPSSPIWSNFGAGRALPISCNGSFADDTVDSIVWKNAEIGIMTKEGAGTSLYLGKVRPKGSPISTGGKSEGPLHFARLTQEQVTVISQANVRRGNCSVWLDVEHPDIHDFLMIKSITDGVHHPIQDLSFGVCIGDDWLLQMLAEPKGGDRRRLMAKIINKRRATGFPYIFFSDNANAVRHPRLKELGRLIYASNLCTEIMLPSSPDESFVCNLSSVNLLYWHEWKNTMLVREMVYFLDAVMTDYIDKTDPVTNPTRRLLADAHRFAKRWRALGVGTLGYHSLFQSLMIPFESEEARALNIEMHKHIGEQALMASHELANIFGEPEGLKGTGLRNLTQCAIAPTTSSSIILGQVSKGIEPWPAVVFENDNAKGVFTHHNPIFVQLLRERGKDTEEVWHSILVAGGSVAHLDFLSPLEREVFKPWVDISQEEVIRQAADRGRYIDQGQSLNLKIRPEVSKQGNLDLILLAWRSGLKSLYYHEGVSQAQELARSTLSSACVACEA